MKICFEIQTAHAPALKAAVDDFTSMIGRKLESPHAFKTEDTLTRAACAIGALRASVNAVVGRPDPDYR